MSSRAHMLVQVDPGRSREAAQYLSALATVAQAVITSGAYDVIATVSAGSEDAVRVTVARARQTPGLCALRLCWSAPHRR
jgi:hypothetical protein